MMSILYLLIAIVHAGAWTWGTRVWRRSRRPFSLTLVWIAAAPAR